MQASRALVRQRVVPFAGYKFFCLSAASDAIETLVKENTMKLEGSVALVSGGASGLGEATVRLLAVRCASPSTARAWAGRRARSTRKARRTTSSCFVP